MNKKQKNIFYSLRNTCLLIIAGASLLLNGVAMYVLYSDSTASSAEPQKAFVRDEKFDYDAFMRDWGKAWIGVEVDSVDHATAQNVMIDRPEGALVTEVDSGSPADKAGIKTGDVIMSFNGRKIRTPLQFKADLAGSEVGSVIDMCVANTDYRKTIDLIPEQRPSNLYQLYSPELPFLGINVSQVAFGSEEEKEMESIGRSGGVLVEKVLRNSPAEKAGVEEDDIIMSFNYRKVTTLREFLSDAASVNPGSEVPMCITRPSLDDARKTIYIIPEERPVSHDI